MLKKMQKTGKKILSVLLALVLVMSVSPMTVTAVTTNEDGYIEVSTIEELYNIRNDLTANYILMNDIDLTEATAEGGDWDFEGRGWNPIGSEDIYSNSAFSGTFDGNGYSIHGMRIEYAYFDCPEGTGEETYTGLFANVTGEISNLTLSDVNIYVSPLHGDDDDNVGAITGKNEGTIVNCNVTGNINTAGDQVGAITGYNSGTIENSYNTAPIQGYGATGGLAGINEGIIQNCYNLGAISSKNDAGGIAGQNYLNSSAVGEIITSYNMGTVSGITAYASYAIANSTYGTVTNCYYLAGIGKGAMGAVSLTEAQMRLGSIYQGFDFDDTWIQNANAKYPYPQLTQNPQDLRVIREAKINSMPNKLEYQKGEALDLKGCALVIEYENAETEYVAVTDDMITGYDENKIGEQTVIINYSYRQFEFTVMVQEKPFTEIYTIMDLYNIRYDLDGNYILMNDIDLTEATAEGGEWDFDGRGWNPIGSNDVYSNNAFSGIFDGNGHAIKGMKITLTADKKPSGVGDVVYVGLFAFVTGTVNNLKIENVSINVNLSEEAYIGAVAGKTAGGNITGCSASGTTEGTTQKDSSNEMYVGGLVGYNDSVITKSYNESFVSATNYLSQIIVYAGGVAGYNVATIENCYNAGNVDSMSAYVGDFDQAGGVAGVNFGKVLMSYNVGSVTALQKADAYAITTGGTVSNCYYLGGSGAGVIGATALTEAQATLDTMYGGFDFENIWYLNADAVYPYAQLQDCTQDMRIISKAEISSLPYDVTYVKGETFEANGLELTFMYENAETEIVQVTNNMVRGFDSSVIGVQSLTVTYNRKTFAFDVTVEEKPFIEIHTVGDLYSVRNDLTANYILMNDLDLTEATAKGGEWDFDGRGWNPIGSNDVYGNGAYSGIFDGNGHTIKGMRIYVRDIPAGTGDVYLGLFSNITGEVRNLKIEQVDIDVSLSTYKSFYVGGVAGYSTKGIIRGCNVEGKVYVRNSYDNYGSSLDYVYAYVGGMVGYNLSTITQSYVQGTVTGGCTTIAAVKSVVYAGGIAGYGSGEITNCYNTAQINATGNRAHTSGINYMGTITNCYNVGITSEAAIASYGTITNCYYLADTGTGIAGATSLTDTQLKLAPMYSGFDFENVWTLNSYANYPYAQLRDNVQDLNETVELIRVISYPTKTDYLTGDEIDLTGAMFEAIYISGKTELLEITSDMISGYDPTLIGEQTITVTYGGQTDNFIVNVERRPEVTGVELVSEPTAKEFVVGTAFDFSGAKVKVSYDNGTSEEINVTEDMTTGGNINHIATQTITVVCGTYSTTFVVEVVPATVLSISIATLPSKLVYMEGEDLDTAGMEVMATYSNGTSVQIKSGYTVTGYSAEPGTHEVTIEFAGQKVSFEVTVNERVLSNIEIKANPDKTDYVVGEELDLTGLIVVAAYENGDLDIITDYTVFGYDGTPGSKVITLTYGGKTASFIVNVVIKCVTKLEITKQPVKQTYIENEALNVDGMIVKATYNDGEEREVTDYDLNGFSSLPGTHTVYVSYEGQVDSFEVNVTAKVLSDLRVTLPTKTAYIIGEEFDATGLEVVACYNNGQEYSVDNYVMTGFDSKSAGAKEIQISYGGMTRSFVIIVTQKSSIETGGAVKLGTAKGRLGESVQISVTITKNTGLAAFCHTITFDATDLKFVSVTANGGFANGTIVLNDEKSADGEITVLWFNPTDVIESGVAYTLDFEVLETATDGISDISVAFDENDNGNASGENVIFEAINGSVEVLSYWLGDLNGDREYAMVDLLQLAQYVSGKTMTLTEKQKLSADVNEDGIIDIHDVTLLSQWLLSAEM